MKKSNLVTHDDLNNDDKKIIEKNDSALPTSIEYVVNEVSTLLKYNGHHRNKELESFQFFKSGGLLSINASDIYKSSQLSSKVHLKSSDPLLLSLTALLSNPHHATYLSLMTHNLIEVNEMNKKMGLFENFNKMKDSLSKNSKNTLVNLIASNLQYYLFEGKATSVVISDLVITLMKAISSEKSVNFVANDFNKWGANSQAFIEARDWSVIISSKECIFPKTCYELRELLIKQGIKLKSYFQSIDSAESYVNVDKINTSNSAINSQDTLNSSIDEVDARYLNKQTSFSKSRIYKSNNIPNYSQFEQIKRHISINLPNIKSLFHSPGTCVYISGNDVITFLQVLKKVVEDTKQEVNNSDEREILLKKNSYTKDPYWFMKEIKRIVSNFPIRDSVFKVCSCNCDYIHVSDEKKKGFYELKMEGLFLPSSLFVIINGLKLLCSDLQTYNISFENVADPPFFPLESLKTSIIWEKTIPILNTITSIIGPRITERAMIWKPFNHIFFDKFENGNSSLLESIEQSQYQVNHNTYPVFSLPRKRCNQIMQYNCLQRSFCLNTTYKTMSGSQNVNIGSSVINSNNQELTQPTSNTNLSNILDFSISNGILDNLNFNGSINSGIVNSPHLTGSSIENQALFSISQQNSNLQHPPLLPSAGVRARNQNSISANVQWLNFKGIGFSSHNSNYVSLATPMGKQLLHRIGTINPIQRLENNQTLPQNPMRFGNFKNQAFNQYFIPNSENFSTITSKIFDETALCFLGFDAERLEYFSARAVEEGAKVVTLNTIQKEYDVQFKRFNLNKVKVSQFVYSWLQVTRFYCVINESFVLDDFKNLIAEDSNHTVFPFEIQQLVSLEWFLTACFEKRPLDPDIFTPISRPFISGNFLNFECSKETLIVILDNFPHMSKIYNSSKNGQATLSHAIWTNCMQRILKMIYKSDVVNIKEISNIFEKENFNSKINLQTSIIVVPCNIVSYKSNTFIDNLAKDNLPLSVLYGSSKCQFLSDIEYIKKKINNLNIGDVEDLLHIVSPSWLLESCSKRQKIDYLDYELKYFCSSVKIRRRRKRDKICQDDMDSSFRDEEVCLFHKKNDMENQFTNLIPSYGPWPLWGWIVYLLRSRETKFSNSINNKLKEVGAICLESKDFFEDIVSFSNYELSHFLQEVGKKKVGLILCNDFLDLKLKEIISKNEFAIQKFEGIINRNIIIVNESWINMVHGTRTLHPFDSNFYFLGPNKNKLETAVADECKNDSGDLEIFNNVNGGDDVLINKMSSQDVVNKENKQHQKKNLGQCMMNCESLKIEENFKVTLEKVNFNKDSFSEKNISDFVGCDTDVPLIKQKKRRVSKNKLDLSLKPLQIGQIDKYEVNRDIVEKEKFENKVQGERFLVPLSLSFFSSCLDNQGEESIPMLISSLTPVRKLIKENQLENQLFRTPTNWISPKHKIEEYTELNFSTNQESRVDLESQTEVATIKNAKDSNEYENDYLGNTTATENVSPILCPMIPSNTFTF